MFGEDVAYLLRDRLVDLEARFDEYQVRTLALRRHRWHRRPDAELAGFVTRCRHNAAFAGSADGNRLAAEIRIVPLLDRRVERVHVDVDDLAMRRSIHIIELSQFCW